MFDRIKEIAYNIAYAIYVTIIGTFFIGGFILGLAENFGLPFWEMAAVVGGIVLAILALISTSTD